jgi:hypothetical protein
LPPASAMLYISKDQPSSDIICFYNSIKNTSISQLYKERIPIPVLLIHFSCEKYYLHVSTLTFVIKLKPISK